jgi:hypothetical protein
MSGDDSFWESLRTLRKFNPFVLVLIFGLFYVSNLILNSGLPLEQKAFPYVLSLVFVFMAVVAEFYRLEREKELGERVYSG